MFDLNISVLRAAVLASSVATSVLTLGCSVDPSGARRPSGPNGAAAMSGGPAGASGAAGAGASGTAGVSGAAGVSGSASAGGNAGNAGEGGAAVAGDGDGDGLSVQIENGSELVVEIVTVKCPGDCVEVKAVARGGQPDYHFTWEDGTTSPTRMLCPSEAATHEVTVTDTARDDDEFGHAMETARASVDTRVLDCSAPPETPSSDAGPSDECADASECGASQTCFEGVCVGEGGLRFSLTWSEDTDFDLFVRMPDRTEISFIFDSRGGGMLDVDDCFRSCRIPGGPHVENIFFIESPPRGTYTYWVVNSGGATPGDFRLEVSADGMVQATQTGMIAARALRSERYTFEY